MTSLQSTKINILRTFYVLAALFCINFVFSAEGGPCKDYGECDEFKYSLNDIESLQRGASTILIIVMVVILFNTQDGEELQKIYKFLKKYFLKI